MQLAEKVGLTRPKCRAVEDYLGLREDLHYFKEIKIGKMTHGRYSPEAIKRINDVLATVSIDEIWAEYQVKRKTKR